MATAPSQRSASEAIMGAPHETQGPAHSEGYEDEAHAATFARHSFRMAAGDWGRSGRGGGVHR